MPNNVIDSFAKKSGKSVKDVEKEWKASKEIVKSEYPKIKQDSEDFYKLVTSILKKKLKLEDTTTTTSSIGGTVNGVPDSQAYIYKTKIGKKKKQDVHVESATEYLQRTLNG